MRRVGIRKSLTEFPNGDCVFFHNESRTCQVYNARPRQCRTWPFWNSNLSSPDAWQRAVEHCRGCNRGKLIALEKIEEQRKHPASLRELPVLAISSSFPIRQSISHSFSDCAESDRASDQGEQRLSFSLVITL